MRLGLRVCRKGFKLLLLPVIKLSGLTRDMKHTYTHIDAYLTERRLNQFLNFSREWKESGYFCYELVDVLFFVYLMIQAKLDQVTFSYRRAKNTLFRYAKIPILKI